jgi:hypothetical protein
MQLDSSHYESEVVYDINYKTLAKRRWPNKRTHARKLTQVSKKIR